MRLCAAENIEKVVDDYRNTMDNYYSDVKL